MTLRRWVVAVLAGIVFMGAADYLYLTAGGVDGAQQQIEKSERPRAHGGRGATERETPVLERPRSSIAVSSYRAASSSLPSLPVGSKVIVVEQDEKNGLRETVIKLETVLTPIELSTFYTDELVGDWMIYRDTLTEGMGWNGVFLQYGEIERRLGVFGVVRSRGVGADRGIVTTVSMLLVETLP